MNEVKKPKKPLIFYYGIVLCVILLVNLLVMPQIYKAQIREVDYGAFMQMTQDGKIEEVQRLIEIYRPN